MPIVRGGDCGCISWARSVIGSSVAASRPICTAGQGLSAALDWASRHAAELNASERAFLDQSRSASQRAVERERSINRRLRGLLAGVGALLVVALAASAIALVQADTANSRAAEAQAARHDAEANATAARASELSAAAVSVLGEDPSLSKLLALSAARLVPVNDEIETALHQAAAADAVIDRYTSWPADRKMQVFFTDINPDGDLIGRLRPVLRPRPRSRGRGPGERPGAVAHPRRRPPPFIHGRAVHARWDTRRVGARLALGPRVARRPAEGHAGPVHLGCPNGRLDQAHRHGSVRHGAARVSRTLSRSWNRRATRLRVSATHDTWTPRMVEVDLATGHQRMLVRDMRFDWAITPRWPLRGLRDGQSR